MPHHAGGKLSFDEIQVKHDGDLWLPRYVVRHKNLIVALRLLEKFNPRIHDDQPQVWVGATPRVAEWGNRLANTGVKLNVYVAAPGQNTYTLKGIYRVTQRRHTAAQLAEAREQVPHDLSRIVFLRPA